MRLDPRRIGAWCSTALLAVLWAQVAAAQPTGKARVVVREFSGPSSARVRDAVVQALRKTKRYELVPNERAEDAAEQLDADLSTDAGRAAVGRQLGLAGFVSGTIEKKGRQFVLEVDVHGGESGTQTEQRSFRARKPGPLVGQVRRRFATQLRRKPLELEQPAEREAESRPQLETSEAEPEAEEEEPEPPAEDAPAAKEERDPDRRRADADDEDRAADEAAEADAADEDVPAFEVAVGPRLVTRSFTYEAPETPLPEHSVSPTPALHAQMRLYPGAPFTDGIAAHVGLELHGHVMLPVDAQDGPSLFETTSKGFGGGLRGRIPLWPSELGVHAGWGAHDVEIANSQFDGDPEVPSVAFQYLRFGADARIALSDAFALTVRASYLLLLDHGELADERWFPDASGGAIEAQLGAAYRLGGPLWVAADVGMTRYSVALNVEPAPTGSTVMQRVAEGAVDQHFFGGLTIALRL